MTKDYRCPNCYMEFENSNEDSSCPRCKTATFQIRQREDDLTAKAETVSAEITSAETETINATAPMPDVETANVVTPVITSEPAAVSEPAQTDTPVTATAQ